MIKTLKLLFLMGRVLYSPLSLCNCDFKIEKMSYFFMNNSKIKISMEIDKACSYDHVSKRKISGVTLRLHKENKIISEYKFSGGIWFPASSKFLITNKSALKTGCFQGERRIQINLKDNYINSTKGLYLNLVSMNSLNVDCSELVK